jgi:hypothetical protein
MPVKGESEWGTYFSLFTLSFLLELLSLSSWRERAIFQESQVDKRNSRARTRVRGFSKRRKILICRNSSTAQSAVSRLRDGQRSAPCAAAGRQGCETLARRMVRKRPMQLEPELTRQRKEERQCSTTSFDMV